MPCTSPLYRIDCAKAYSYRPLRKYIRKYTLPFKMPRNGGIILSRRDYANLYDVGLHQFDDRMQYAIENSILQVPCGQCLSCRKAYASNWANRCMLEAKAYDHNYFVTLTYDDLHLIYAPYYDRETGEITIQPTIDLDDVSSFLKRLREKWRVDYGHTGIRFFVCGEYGEELGRPHYHVIFFNLPIPDLRKLPDVKEGLKQSAIINELWNMGRVSIQPVNWRTCAYTARYCIKKLKGKAAKERDETLEQLLETFDFESSVRDHEQRMLSLMTSEERERFPGFRYVERWHPESVRMSRRPGIARDYYEAHKKTIYEFDEVLIPKDNQIVSSKPSKYFDRLYDLVDSWTLSQVKRNRRKFGILANRAKLEATSLDLDSYLANLEYIAKDETSKLIRPL